jgi:hypothetical protein
MSIAEIRAAAGAYNCRNFAEIFFDHGDDKGDAAIANRDARLSGDARPDKLQLLMGIRIVHLDVSTLVFMGSFASACAGVVLLFAWWQNQKVPALGLWGLGNVVSAAGILSLILGPALHWPVLSTLASALLTLAPGLIWQAARSLDHKWASITVAVLGAAVVGAAGAVPATRGMIDILNLTFGAAYLFAAAVSLWQSRQERLAARWPLIILPAVHGAVLLAGAYAFLTGAMGHGRIPVVMSLFGLIHFESIVFVLGTAVFLLALIKERSEAASMIAANTDSLTGVANRGGFMLQAGRVVKRCRLEAMPVSVMMFDLDRRWKFCLLINRLGPWPLDLGTA